MDKCVKVPEKYWPNEVAHCIFDPEILRLSSLAHNNGQNMEIKPWIVLFLLDQYEITRQMKTMLTSAGSFVKGVPLDVASQN